MVLLELCFVAAFGGVLGARLMHVAVEPLADSPLDSYEVDRALSLIDCLVDDPLQERLRTAFSAQRVSSVWAFIVRMPPGTPRLLAIEQAEHDPSVVPASLWYRSRPLEVFAVWRGGLAYFGGLVFAVVFGLLLARNSQLPLGQILDLAAPALMLGLSIGRIGCFLGGCCYGKICGEHWWAHSSSWVGVGDSSDPRYPTALFSVLNAAMLFFLLRWFLGCKKVAGEVWLALFVLYSPGRFLIESVRDDPRGGGAGFSATQICILLTGPVALIGWIHLRLRARKPQASLHS